MEVNILGFIILLETFKKKMFTIHLIFICLSQTVVFVPFFLQKNKTLVLQPPSLSRVCIWCRAGGSCGFGTAACSRPRKVSRVWKRTTCQPNCSQPMPEKSSRGSHYTATVPGRRMGHWGPLAMLQSLMPSICLNGFLNPGPPFDSSPRQAVLHLLSLPVINPFISKRSDQCCLEWELPCWGNAAGKNREFWPQCPWGWKWN